MFKDKFKSMMASKEASDVQFEVLNDTQASGIMGGLSACAALGSCGTFTGSCENLVKCKQFVEKATLVLA